MQVSLTFRAVHFGMKLSFNLPPLSFCHTYAHEGCLKRCVRTMGWEGGGGVLLPRGNARVASEIRPAVAPDEFAREEHIPYTAKEE